VDGTPWCCPRCRGRLEPGRGRWRCESCGASFRALRGIPDLRTREDVYLSNAADWVFARRLDAAYDRLDFRGLLDLYFTLAEEVTPQQKRRQVTHILTAPGRAGRWLDALGAVGDGMILDLGCGSGSFLAAVGGRAGPLCGVDVAFRWLLVARKRLDEEGLGSVPLACACAEDLPVAEGSLAGVVAGDVFEHVADQAATLAEAFRALRPGGRAFFASPNRYSLGPEPHVQLWGVGFLPRAWMGPYVRFMRKMEFRAVRTLGYGEWKRMLFASPFGGGRVTVPPLPADDLAHFGTLKRWAGRAYNAAVATGPGRSLARAVGPLFHVVAEKPGPPETRPTPSRATRPRSRPTAGRA
jgi:SAM-dependent methyltransferase